MAEVRKHGQGGGSFAAAIEKAMAEGARTTGSGAPPNPGQTGAEPSGAGLSRPGQPGTRESTAGSRGSTQHLITASSFLTNDPFLPTAQPAPPDPSADAEMASDESTEPDKR